MVADVQPVLLPKKDEYENVDGEEHSDVHEQDDLASLSDTASYSDVNLTLLLDSTYPPLILDGASGVGKTQQAFALLKGGQDQDPQSLVYVLLAEGAYQEGTQDIYKYMTSITAMNTLLPMIDEAITEQKNAKQKSGEKASDQLSMGKLRDSIINASTQTQTSKIMSLVQWIWNRVLQFRSGEIVRPNRKKEASSFSEQLASLKGTVLFVDEALPSHSKKAKKESHDSTASNRLKFLRNFGRVAGLRVVLAGTAATAANMGTMPETHDDLDNHDDDVASISRTMAEKKTWGEVHFLYRNINTSIKFGANSKSYNVQVRPLVSRWLRTKANDKNLVGTLETISEQAEEAKIFSYETKFIWLSGAYLCSKEIISSPYLLKPSALVRRHFFEPALVTYSENGVDQLYEGSGYERIERKAVSQRVKIIKYMVLKGLVWFLRKEGTPIAIGPEYDFVEYALSNCVQVCLAMEPLFVVALSICNRIEPVSDFRKAFRECLPETPLQRTKGQVDGELHALIIFAALQLASNQDIQSETTMKNFVTKLNNFLKIDYERRNSSMDRIVSALNRKGINDTRTIGKSDQNIAFDEFADCGKGALLKDTFNIFKSAKMPWLVPACDKEMLKNKIQAYGNDFFGDLGIAGLVPGTGTSPMDAKAYRWKSFQEGEEAKLPTDWSFEFKARSCGYSMKSAKDDLMAKCEKDKACHAILIGIANKTKTECHYGVVEVDGTHYLRVVLLVGGKC